MVRRFGFILALVLMAAPVVALLAPERSAAAEQGTLEIATKGGVRVFSVELAVTDEERGKGLMFRKEVPEGYGMLFDFKQEQQVTMWMKNTYVSLDMIFIGNNGRIARIAERTTPESENIISSGQPVRAVLEVVAGTAKKLGIAAGDKVAHPIFNSR
jgi:uncharacterized protein